jgi:hypothetical protein
MQEGTMPITRKEVLEVARDPRLRNISFSVGPVNVNASEYGDVGDYIQSGAISVKPGSETKSKYFPQINTLVTKKADPPLAAEPRSAILHELTHAISDIHKLKITRLNDEVAAYLAQFAYLMILAPDTVSPPIGKGMPLNTMMRRGLQLVDQYHLGEPAGQGAMISQSDISNLAGLIHAIPDYDYDEKELLAADGVSLDDDQAEIFWQLQMQKVMNQSLDEQLRKDVQEMLTLKVRYVTYENYVTDDSELLTLFGSYANGGATQKKSAVQKLIHIFLTVDPRNAALLTQRLSTLKKGDALSERFQKSFSAAVAAELVAALKVQRD